MGRDWGGQGCEVPDVEEIVPFCFILFRGEVAGIGDVSHSDVPMISVGVTAQYKDRNYSPLHCGGVQEIYVWTGCISKYFLFLTTINFLYANNCCAFWPLSDHKSLTETALCSRSGHVLLRVLV
jgi:hypothetical protein